MEKKFLLYLLHIAFVEIRERSYKSNDNATYWLCDLLHNVPLNLSSEDEIDAAYKRLLQSIDTDGMQQWLNVRKMEFYSRYPEFKEDQ